MIQEISPHKFDNAYKNKREPREGDIFIAFIENKAVMKNDSEFFCYQDFEEIPRSYYLFSVDDTAFFLTEDLKGKEYSLHEMRYFREFQPREYGFCVITAYHIAVWYKDTAFCGKCGEKTENSETERAKVCPKCKNIIYPKISPAVIVGVTNGDKILMTKYAGREYTNYALIAGFAEIGEPFEKTVEREVMEEVGLKVKNIRYYSSQPWGFSQSLLVGYFAELDGDDRITLERTELKEGVWKKRDEIQEGMVSQISLTGTMIEKFRQGEY